MSSEPSSSRLHVALLVIVAILCGSLAWSRAPQTAAADEPLIGVPLPAEYLTGPNLADPRPAPCARQDPSGPLCDEPNDGLTVTLSDDQIFVGDTITATASTSVGGDLHWTTSSYSVSGCQTNDRTCTFKPHSHSNGWVFVSAYVQTIPNTKPLAYGDAPYFVGAHLVEGDALVEDLRPPPMLASPYPWPSTALRLVRTDAHGEPSPYLYNGLYNVFGQQVDLPQPGADQGFCYFCSGADNNGLEWLDVPTGRFRAYVPEGWYTLFVIRAPYYGEPNAMTPLPGWTGPITFYVDGDTTIHLRRDLKEIGGRITAPNGQPMSGVSITAGPLGPTEGSGAVTDTSGHYTMMVERGSYVVLPSVGGRVAPTSRTVDVSQNDADNVDFVQEATRVSGWLSSDEGPVRNWEVQAVGPTTQTTRTDESGHYQIELEPATWTVKPVNGGWDPPNQQIQLASSPQEASFTCLDVDQCGNPTLSISYVSGPSQLAIGETATFTFRVANDGETTITDLSITGPTPTIGEGGIVAESGPDPAPPPELGPGSELEISYTVTGDVQGSGRYGWSVTGTSDGDTITRSVARDIQVGDPPLEVTVAAAPDSVEQLTYDDDLQVIPQHVTVTVGITNTGSVPVDHVTLFDDLTLRSALGPVPGVFPLTQVLGPEPTGAIGTLAAGEYTEVTFQLDAMAPGLVEIEALVTSGERNVGTIGSTTFNVATPYRLSFKAQLVDVDNGATINGGADYQALLTLKNVSDDDLVVRLGPATSGNATGAVPIIGSGEPAENQIGTKLTIRAGADPVVMRATVHTIDHAGLTSGVSWTPHVSVLDDEGNETEVGADAVFTAAGSGPYELHVHPSAALPPPQPIGVGEGLYLFTEHIGEGLANTAKGIDALARWAIANPLDAYGIRQYVELQAALWYILSNLTTGEWDDLRDYVVSGLNLAGYQSDDAVDAVNAFIQGEVQGFLETFPSTNPATWDIPRLLEWAGRTTGENIDTVVSLPLAARKLFVKAALSKELALAEKALARQAAEQELGVAERLARGVNFLQDGDPIGRMARIYTFGVDPAIDEGLMAIARKHGVVLGARERSVAAAEWIALGALPKPPGLNFLKSINKIDTEFLGFIDEGSLVVRPPRPWNEVAADLAAKGADDAQWTTVNQQWLRREEEWNEGKALLDKYVRDGIPIPSSQLLDGTHNGVPNFGATVYEQRTLQLEELTMPDGVKGYAVKVADEAGVMRRVASDVDLLYIASATGEPLTAYERMWIGRDLAAIGIQHFETYTWLKQGQRAEILGDYVAGSAANRPMLLYEPSGTARAARFDPRKSIMRPGVPPEFLYLEGAELRGAISPDTSVIIEAITQDIPPMYVTPATVKPTAGPTALEFDRGPDAVVASLGEGGRLRTWMPDSGWSPLTDTRFDGKALPTLPQTSIAAAVPAGSTEIPINELAVLAPEWPAGTPWFQVGDQIVLDPGGSREETATLVGFGSLVLAEPTRFAHAAGETVTVVPADAPPVDVTPPAIACGTPATTWSRTDVQITCTASDAGIGLADPAQAQVGLTTSVAPGVETAAASTGSVSICDVAGNCATAGPITGLKVDRAAPAINVSTPQAGASYVVGATVVPVVACTDGGAGVAACTAPATLNTSSAGTRDVTVQARDAVGNERTLTVRYIVTKPLPVPKLLVSTIAKLKSPSALQGKTLKQPSFVFVEAVSGIEQVEFTLDGGRLRTADTRAPWTLLAFLNVPLPLLPRALAKGSHTLTAVIRFQNGAVQTVSATFRT